jgi:CheY-like chemotaxis protein
MDGVTFVARLRADERTKHRPIIVLTACAWQRDRDRARAAGCDAFLPKPCPPADLVREIRFQLAQRQRIAALRSVRLKAVAVRRTERDKSERTHTRQFGRTNRRGH